MTASYSFLENLGLSQIDAILSTLLDKTTSSATRDKALARLNKLLQADDDLDATLDNLPALMRSRNFTKAATALEDGLRQYFNGEPELVADEERQVVEVVPMVVATSEDPAVEDGATAADETQIDDTNGDTTSADIATEVDDMPRKKTDETFEADSEDQVKARVAATRPAAEAEQDEPEADVAAAARAEFEAAEAACIAARSAYDTAKERFKKAKRALRRNGKPVAPRVGRPRASSNGSTPSISSTYGILLGLLQRPEGVTQAQMREVKALDKLSSVAYHAKKLAERLGRELQVEGEAKERVFRIAA